MYPALERLVEEVNQDKLETPERLKRIVIQQLAFAASKIEQETITPYECKMLLLALAEGLKNDFPSHKVTAGWNRSGNYKVVDTVFMGYMVHVYMLRTITPPLIIITGFSKE